MLVKFAVIMSAALAVSAHPTNGGWSNVPWEGGSGPEGGITTRSPDATSSITSAITEGISTVGTAITSATSALSSALSSATSSLASLPNSVSSAAGSSGSASANASQCGESQLLSCCNNNSDSSTGTPLLPFIAANCVPVSVGVVPAINQICGSQSVACCSSTQQGLINLEVGCIPLAA